MASGILINGYQQGGTIGPVLTNISSIVSPTGQTLTLATLDSNANVIVAPHGTGAMVVNAGVNKSIVFQRGASANSGIGSRDGSGVSFFNDAGEVMLIQASSTPAFRVNGNYSFGFSGGLTSAVASDVGLTRQSAGVLRVNLAESGSTTSGTLLLGTARFGDATSGPTITATGSSPNELLVLSAGGYSLKQSSAFSSPMLYTDSGSMFIGSNGSGGVWFNATHLSSINQDMALGVTTNFWKGAYLSAGNGVCIGKTGTTATDGLVNTAQQTTKPVTGILNATATNVLTITVPNAAHAATVRVCLHASLGAGGSIGANEGSACIAYDISVTRTANANAVVGISTAYGSASSSVATGQTCTVTAAMSAVTGGTTVSNTFAINVTISRSGAGATNHTCLVKAEILNSNASGITLS